MPARELRDTERGDPAAEDTSAAPLAPSPLLLVPPAFLQRVAVEMVLSDFDSAKTAREAKEFGFSAKGDKLTFDTWLKELKDLYFGHREPKTLPWKFCSNRSLMIGMAILEVLHARLLPGVYNEELTRWRPGEASDVQRAERVEKLMFWWIRVRVKLREFFDRWVRYAIGFGTVVTETSWDIQLLDRGQTAQTPPMAGPDGQLLETESERVFDRFETTRSDVIPLEDVFLQPGATSIQRDTLIIRKRFLYRDLEEMERDGRVVNVSQATETGLFALKEKLPVPTPQGEGLTPEQLEELANVKRRNVLVECLQWYGGIDLDGDGYPEQVRLLIIPEHRLYLAGVELRHLSGRGMRHVDLTQFFPRLDDPNGLSGLGALEQVKELALEIDAIFNQMTDANSLSVMRPGFFDPGGDVDVPALSLAPNKWTPVSNPQAAVYIPEFNVPTERLLNAIKVVLEFIERLTAASAYIFGKESEIVGGSGTATRTQEIVQAAGQRHSIPMTRLREGAARIMTHHLDEVQLHLPPGLESRVLGEEGEPVFENANELTLEGIRGEFDAYLLPDEALGSRETERYLAQVLYDILTQNLIVATDPTKLYKVTADLLKSYGKKPEQYLGPEPLMNTAKSPQEENTLILQGAFAQVRPTVLDNHIEHLMAHQALLEDPGFLRLNPALQAQVGAFIQQHAQQHVQMIALIAAAAQKGGRGRGGENGANRDGAGGGRARTAPPIGAEPGVGSTGSAVASTRATQRVGESQPPSQRRA